MSQAFSEEKKQQLKEDILKQRESGLSVEKWCRKNNIAAHTFYYWQKKLFPKILDRSAFTEISNESAVCNTRKTGVMIEYQEILIHLDRRFDLPTLKQCLEVLKEVKC